MRQMFYLRDDGDLVRLRRCSAGLLFGIFGQNGALCYYTFCFKNPIKIKLCNCLLSALQYQRKVYLRKYVNVAIEKYFMAPKGPTNNTIADLNKKCS